MARFAALASLFVGGWLGSVVAASGQDPVQMVELAEPAVARITVTNLMKGQILTPAVFITHNDQTPPLFVPGQPASQELAALAERGYTGGLVNKFNAEQGVLHVTRLAQFVRPMTTASVDVEFNISHRLVSSASMIEMTNDGFASLLGVEIPCEGPRTVFIGGWDAGSEANSELCSEIPAPCPVPARSGRCSVGSAEGAVHVHAGIHGCGGFPPETYDWRHPIAMITIEAVADASPDGALAAACPDRASADTDSTAGSDQDGTDAVDGDGTGTGAGGE